MSKRPSFQFYPQDFVADINVQLMTAEQRGVYIMLLCYDWINGGIPADDRALSILSGVNEQVFDSVRCVLKCFQLIDGKYYNPRLMQEREKQDEYREKKRAAGVASGINRRKSLSNNQHTGRTGVEQVFDSVRTEVDSCVRTKMNSSSSSSTSDIKKEYKEKNPCESEAIQPVAEQPEPESKPAQKRKKEFIPPTAAEVKEYARSRRSHIDPQKFFDFYDAGSWKDSKGKPVLNWKQKFLTWEGREPRPEQEGRTFTEDELADIEKYNRMAEDQKGKPDALDTILLSIGFGEKDYTDDYKRQNGL